MHTAFVAALVALSLVGPASGNKATQIVGVPAAGTQAWKIFNSKMSLTVLPVSPLFSPRGIRETLISHHPKRGSARGQEYITILHRHVTCRLNGRPLAIRMLRLAPRP